jgi:ketosteroid isomerase-like protein
MVHLMKTPGSRVAAVLAAAFAISGAARADDVAQIRELEAELSRAVLAGDAATFDRLFADDFTHTSHTGRFRNKADWLKDVKPGRSLYSAYDVEDQAIRVYGSTAVVTGRITPQGTNSKGEPITGQYRFLRVWVKRDSQWRAVAFQGTRIQQESP